MSRGHGRMQRALLMAIKQHGKPMTFGELRAQALGDDRDRLRASFERSMRRALHRMACDGTLMAIGDGGRGEPYRYFIHPLIIGMMGQTPEAQALQNALEADPGAEKAAATWMAGVFPQGRP